VLTFVEVMLITDTLQGQYKRKLKFWQVAMLQNKLLENLYDFYYYAKLMLEPGN